jgi:prepilin-type N-terminal cleavage/methylation domain-containing protein
VENFGTFLKKAFCHVEKNQLGMSLIEVIIGMALVSVVSLSVSQVVSIGSRAQKSLKQKILWDDVKNEINILLSSSDSCKRIFQQNPVALGGPYFVPGPPSGGTVLTTNTDLLGKSLAIPRTNVGANPFYPGKAEPRDASDNPVGSSAIVLDRIWMKTVTQTGAQFEIILNIEAHKHGINNEAKALGATKYSQDFTINVTQNTSTTNCPGTACHYNDLTACSTSLGDMTFQQNCQDLGGQWITTPAPGQPQCQVISAPVPAPPAAPVPAYSPAAYTQLCPLGMAVSGVDFSTGYARASCTNSSPGDGSSCLNGVLTWVPDTTFDPAGGRYRCIQLPGTATTTTGCDANSHLFWDGTQFSCTSDVGSNPAPVICNQPWQYSFWNGSQFECGNFLTPDQQPTPTTAGPVVYPIQTPVGHCSGDNEFLQWDGSKYICGKLKPTNPCTNNQVLVWSTQNGLHCDNPSNQTIPWSPCSANQFLYYDKATGTTGCYSLSPPASDPTPTQNCSSLNKILDFDPSTRTYKCVDYPPPPTPDGYGDIDYSSCSVGEQGYWGSKCPVNQVAVGVCGSGASKDCNGAWHDILCCKLKNPNGFDNVVANDTTPPSSTGTWSRAWEFRDAWTSMFCKPGQYLVGVCGGGSGSDCKSRIKTDGSAAAFYYMGILCSGGHEAYIKSRSMSGTSCHAISDINYGEMVTCPRGEYAVGYCTSGSGKDCNVGDIFMNNSTNAYSVTSQTETKYNTQIFCCPIAK